MGLIDKALSNMKDYHLPMAGGMFLIGTVMQWFHKLDMAYVAYAGTILGAITGHAFSPAQQDKPGDSQPTPPPEAGK
jgi:hypothetical protein